MSNVFVSTVLIALLAQIFPSSRGGDDFVAGFFLVSSHLFSDSVKHLVIPSIISMWKFKSADDSGGNPLLESLNGNIGRQVWVHDADAGSKKDRENVERLRERFMPTPMGAMRCEGRGRGHQGSAIWANSNARIDTAQSNQYPLLSSQS
jgi:hypothetical protein